MYETTTHGVSVTVTPTYLDDQSRPQEGQWVWAYRVVVENRGTEVATLRSRYWQITDANGQVEEVEGPGVVGEQPTLSPGDSFTYTSGCPLRTSSGFMRGHYRMEGSNGEFFEVEIPAFSLDVPARSRVLN